MPIQGMTPEEILVATAEQVASGAKSTDRASKLPGETSAEANARLTAAYREMTAKPVLTPEMEDAGYEVKFVRKGAGGVGIYEAVAPIFAEKVENNQTTEWTMGIIPTIGGKLTGTTLGAWSNGDGTVTNIGDIPFTTIISKGAEPVLAATTLDGEPASMRTGAPVVSTATKYTPAELQRIVSKLSSGGTLTAEERLAITTDTSTAAQNDAPDDQYYTVKVGTTGKTQAQLDAAKGAQPSIQLNKDIAQLLGGTIDPATGKVINVAGKFVESIVPNADGTTTVTASDGTKTTIKTPTSTVSSSTSSSGAVTGKTISKTVNNPDGSITYFYTDGTSSTVSAPPSNANNSNAAATKYAADMAKASEDAATKYQRESAWAILKAEFSKYGLGSLADAVKQMIINGTPTAQATMILRERPEYKARFAGNEARRTAGLNVYDEGTYLDLENAMAEIFTAYGQKSLMGSTREQQQATFAKYIGGTIAPTELKRRMDIASTLSKSDNSTIKAIKELYPMINDSDIFSYFLNPTETLPKLETKAQAASIGGAFLAQGLKINSASMEEYAALGISREQAQLGAAQIASVLPRAAQLRAYENGTYTQQQAEDVYLRQSATAKKELEDLAKLETGRMSGASGTSKVSLKSASRNII